VKTYDPYTKYHGKLNPERIVPRYTPLFTPEWKQGYGRLSHSHVRKTNFACMNLLTRDREFRDNPLPTEFKSILELSTRAPYCPCPFVLDTMMGVCQYNCIYCFTALSVSSLLTSFFDSDQPLRPRYASPELVTKTLNEVLSARGVEPYERMRSATKSKSCAATNEPASLKKAAAQRIPLRIGTRSECFLSAEREKGSALAALKVLREHEYPTIINTKSDLVIEEPYLSLISEMGDHLAVQVSLVHNDDKISKLIEPGAPPSSRRWKVLEVLNGIGIQAMPRMEPAAAFLNNDDAHLKAYFENAVNAGVKSFMGDTYHYTVKAQEVREMFYRIGVDFDRMWEATSEWQILGSYVMEKAMYYAKQRGIRAGTFNFHSLPWNDDPVCCMVGNKFGSWNKYSMVSFLRNELVERGKASFEELDNKYYGYELHPDYRKRIRSVWNLTHLNGWNPDWMEGAFIHSEDSKGNLVWAFDPDRMGEGYEGLIAMQGGKNNGRVRRTRSTRSQRLKD